MPVLELILVSKGTLSSLENLGLTKAITVRWPALVKGQSINTN